MTSAPVSLSFRLPLPPKGVGSNVTGGHWFTKAAPTREYREQCASLYLEQARDVMDPLTWKPLDRVEVDVEMRVCRKRLPAIDRNADAREYQRWAFAYDRLRVKDEGNVHAAIKAALDALQPDRIVATRRSFRHDVGAGVVVNDSAKHMSVGKPRLVEVDDFDLEGVFLTVTEVRDA